MHRSNTIYMQIQFKQALTNMSVDIPVRGQQGMDFFTGGSIIYLKS